jgi:hypothetical protein
LGIIVQEKGCFSLPIIACGLSICAALFAICYVKNNRQPLQSIGFGVGTYFLSTFLGMFTFFVHLDRNYFDHYSKQIVSPSSVITVIIESDLKPNARYVKFFLKIQTINKQEDTEPPVCTCEYKPCECEEAWLKIYQGDNE